MWLLQSDKKNDLRQTEEVVVQKCNGKFGIRKEWNHYIVKGLFHNFYINSAIPRNSKVSLGDTLLFLIIHVIREVVKCMDLEVDHLCLL